MSNQPLRSVPATQPLLERFAGPPRKLAVLRASRLGDLLCAVPALRALRAAAPQTEISLITLPLLRELAERLPYIHRFIPFPGFPGIAEQLYQPRKTAEFFAVMQRERFDLAVQLQGSGVYANPFIRMIGARHTAGFIRPGDPQGLLDAALPLPSTGHEAERVLALTSFLGAPPVTPSLEFPLTPRDHDDALRLLALASRPFIGVHASSREPLRRWPEERFSDVARALCAETGGTIVLIGDTEAAAVNSRLAVVLGASTLDLTERTSLPVLGAVIEALDLLVTNDSGPAHIAYSLGVPTVTITTPVPAARYGPLGPGPFKQVIAPCPGHDYTVIDCDHLHLLEVPEVLEAAFLLLAGPAIDTPPRLQCVS